MPCDQLIPPPAMVISLPGWTVIGTVSLKQIPSLLGCFSHSVLLSQQHWEQQHSLLWRLPWFSLLQLAKLITCNTQHYLLALLCWRRAGGYWVSEQNIMSERKFAQVSPSLEVEQLRKMPTWNEMQTDLRIASLSLLSWGIASFPSGRYERWRWVSSLGS